MALTVDQLNSLQKGSTTIRMLVKVAAGSGVMIRVALNSSKVPFEGEEYKPAPFTPSEFESLSGLGVSNMTFDVQLKTTFERLQLKGGIWQGAKVEMIIIDVSSPGIGAIFRQKGRFGQVQIQGRAAQIEYRSNANLLGQEVGFKYSRDCRSQLGVNDGLTSFCNVNLAAYTFAGTVTAVANDQKFTISVSKADRYFYRGKIAFTSGDCEGLEMETQSNTGQVLTLFKPMPASVQVGDTFSIVAGDDKTYETCNNKFNSAIDFFGEETIPETSKAFKVPE